MTAYYNEIDSYAAQWLRNLIDAGHIAPGIVDERSIEDVRPVDLHGFTQCHFFAGIGVWSLALRRAGWSDDRAIWTASCPCQPFSQAGEGAGFADERHLWPHLHYLIEQRRPAVVLGEQVASKDADPWVDLVHTDLEAVGYAFGAVAFPSAGIGAPHIRDRTYWVANAGRSRLAQCERLAGVSGGSVGTDPGQAIERDGVCAVGRLGHADGKHAGRHGGDVTRTQARGSGSRFINGDRGVGADLASGVGGLADAPSSRHSEHERDAGAMAIARGRDESQESEARRPSQAARDSRQDGDRLSPTNGLWRDADWLFCRDGKWRPVEPGTFPLAHGAAARVGRLRAYGNAVNASAAEVFIRCVMECTP